MDIVIQHLNKKYKVNILCKNFSSKIKHQKKLKSVKKTGGKLEFAVSIAGLSPDTIIFDGLNIYHHVNHKVRE